MDFDYEEFEKYGDGEDYEDEDEEDLDEYIEDDEEEGIYFSIVEHEVLISNYFRCARFINTKFLVQYLKANCQFSLASSTDVITQRICQKGRTTPLPQKPTQR